MVAAALIVEIRVLGIWGFLIDGDRGDRGAAGGPATGGVASTMGGRWAVPLREWRRRRSSIDKEDDTGKQRRRRSMRSDRGRRRAGGRRCG
jgi:hypothetical protein